MSEALPRSTLGDLAARAVAAEGGLRSTVLEQLGRGTREADQAIAIAERLFAFGPAGETALVEWAGHVRIPLPEPALEKLLPLLAKRAVPPPVRVQAAARALASLPDESSSVRRIVRPLTAGLSPLRRLERLRQLQHQVDKSRSLDQFIERREARLKMDCPRCGQRFPRQDMVRHLWHEHGLMLERGKVRSPRRAVEELQAEHAATRDTTVLDRTSLVAGAAAIRAWVAASNPPAEDVEPLREQAAECGMGLCPGCFAERPPSIPPLVPPLALSAGRLAGDGYAVSIGGADWIRTLTVSSPTKTFHYGPDSSAALGARGLATLLAAFLLALAFLIVVLGSKAWAAPAILVRFVLVAFLGYALVRLLWKPPLAPGDRAVEAAWSYLVPRLIGGNRTSGWLARLCRTSLGRGDPEARTPILSEVRSRAAAGTTAADLQLLAAAGMLEADDRARMGQDRGAAIAALFAVAFRGEQPAAFAEYAAECYLSAESPPEPAERARMRVLLLETAFEAGFHPRDLIELWSAAPSLRRLMSVEPLHRLALLRGVWSMAAARTWERIARADSIFELCRSAPNISGRLLADYPDLLLLHRPDPDTEARIGPVLICTRGIVVGGHMLADPESDVRIDRSGRGGVELIFGPHRFALERSPVGDFASVVREWLRFRAWALLPLLDNYLASGSTLVSERVLKPMERRCPHCGTMAAIARAEPVRT